MLGGMSIPKVPAAQMMPLVISFWEPL